MSPVSELERGREAYDRREWEAAHRSLGAADRRTPLGPEDLWRLGQAAYLTGRDDELVSLLDRAHRGHLEDDDPVAAARCAFWVGFHLANRGETGPATGWLGRAARLLERAGGDHVEAGFLLLHAAHARLATGDPAGAFENAAAALAAGERFGDPELVALALQLQGHAAIGQGRVEEGLALLDEAMIPVATGELSPVVTGLVYCAVIGACRRVYELGRAHQWTAALRDWCSKQPDLVPYRGECLVYRSEILQLRGAWDEALGEARRASEISTGADFAPAAGSACYQEGELHRLRGEYAAAEEAYRNATRAGREPQPGLALLRLAQGDIETARASLRRVAAEARDPLRRARYLPACVEIALAAGDLDEARSAAEELDAIAAEYHAKVLEAQVAHARGAVALADDDPLTALTALRRGLEAWQSLDAPYDAARARVLLARACRDLGDDDTADFELDAARAAFDALGAAPDVAALDGRRERGRPGRAHGLTPRELEVLGLVATGRTNRAIAETLFISEKTVARHVSNIFTKLGLSSRAAATAYAYEHELV